MAKGEKSQFHDDIGPISNSSLYVGMRSTHSSIINGIKQRDPVARERFMRRYFDPCRCYYEREWKFDNPTSKDLATEVLWKIINPEKEPSEPKKEILKTYDPQRRFYKYLFRILDNAAIDFCKAMGKEPSYNAKLTELNYYEGKQIQNENNYSKEHIDKRKGFYRSLIINVIQEVKAKEVEFSPEKENDTCYDMDILIQMECENRTSTEIAEDTGLSDNAVRARKRAAIIRFKKVFMEYLSELTWTPEQIDDLVRDILYTIGSEQKLLLQVVAGPYELDEELQGLAVLPLRELREEIIELFSALGSRKYIALSARLLGISELQLKTWFEKQQQEPSVKIRIAALCEILAVFACGNLDFLNEYELSGLVSILRDIPREGNRSALEDVKKLLHTEFCVSQTEHD